MTDRRSRLVIVDAGVGSARVAGELGCELIHIQRPGGQPADLVRPGDRYYSVDFSTAEFDSFVQQVLAPLRVDAVVSISEAGVLPAARAIELLGLSGTPLPVVRRLQGKQLVRQRSAELAQDHLSVLHAAVTESEPGMTRRILIMNRGSHAVLYNGGACVVPRDLVEPYLLTHSYGGVDGLDPQDFADVFVVDVRADEEIQQISEWLVGQRGIVRVVALQEKFVLPAARLRSTYGLAGTDLATATRFRDKVLMKDAVSSAGIPVPRYRAIDSPADLAALPWPADRLVLKPRSGQGGKDVHVVDSLDQCQRLWASLQSTGIDFEVEEFIDGNLYHCDAVRQAGQLRYCFVSQYIGRPNEFGLDGFLASRLVDDASLTGRMTAFTNEVLDALGLVDGVCHLELFRTRSDGLVLCETACRPSGSLVCETIRYSSGIDLISAAIHIDAGIEYRPEARHTAMSGGQGRCWGCVSVYTRSGSAGPVPPSRFSQLGVVEHRPGPGRGRPPQHCTDYANGYVFEAADEEEWLFRLGQLVAGGA